MNKMVRSKWRIYCIL